MVHNKDKTDNNYQTLMIPIVIVNGIVSGIISVITAYFFKPIWNKIVNLWNKT